MIFGFPLYVHILKKRREPSWILIERREYLLDTMNSPKTSGFHLIEISKDVTFDEETALMKSRRCQLEEVHEEDVPPRNEEAESSPEIVASEDHDMLEPWGIPYYAYLQKEKTCLDKRNHTRSREVWSSRRLHKNKQEIKAILQLCSFDV